MIDALVHVVIHVMLQKPQALGHARTDWYCSAGRRHTIVPVPESLIRSYERELRREGSVTEQFGFGTWTVGSSPTADVAFLEGDHIDVLTHLSQARRFLPPFLHRLRVDLDQREALGEILGGAYGAPAQTRTRILVTLPFARADYPTLASLHRIFGDRGRGGATQVYDRHGVTVYSAATAASRLRVEVALRRAGFAFSEAPETFVTDDAPPCPLTRGAWLTGAGAFALAPPSAPRDRIVTQFSWLPNVEYAGFFLAQQRGYFAHERIAHHVRPGGPRLAGVAAAVASGGADVGVDELDKVADAVRGGHDLVVLGAIYQRPVGGFLSLPRRPFVRAADLVGARVGLQSGGREYIEGILRLNALPLRYTPVAVGATPDALLAGACDVYLCYMTNQPLMLDERRIAYVARSLTDFGYFGYDNGACFAAAANYAHAGRRSSAICARSRADGKPTSMLPMRGRRRRCASPQRHCSWIRRNSESKTVRRSRTSSTRRLAATASCRYRGPVSNVPTRPCAPPAAPICRLSIRSSISRCSTRSTATAPHNSRRSLWHRSTSCCAA